MSATCIHVLPVTPHRIRCSEDAATKCGLLTNCSAPIQDRASFRSSALHDGPGRELERGCVRRCDLPNGREPLRHSIRKHRHQHRAPAWARTVQGQPRLPELQWPAYGSPQKCREEITLLAAVAGAELTTLPGLTGGPHEAPCINLLVFTLPPRARGR